MIKNVQDDYEDFNRNTILIMDNAS